jgi:hypothetical protein
LFDWVPSLTVHCQISTWFISDTPDFGNMLFFIEQKIFISAGEITHAEKKKPPQG